MAIFSSLATFVTSIGTWFAGLGTFGQFAVRLGVALLFNAAASALVRPDRPRDPGIKGSLGAGAEVPRSFIMGQYATAGSLVYRNSWGTGNDSPALYYTVVVAVSDLPVSGLDHIWVAGQKCTLDTGSPDGIGRGFPVNEFLDGGKHHMWVNFYDGTQSVADSFLQNYVSSTERPWSTDRVGNNIAYAVLTFRFNRKLFPSFQATNTIFVVNGITIKDWVTDTSSPADTNPINQALAILSGIKDPQGNWFYGQQGLAAGRFDSAEAAAEATECNLPVPGAAQMTSQERIEAFGADIIPEKYRSSLEVLVDAEPIDTLRLILAACNGRTSDVGTRFRVQVGNPKAASFTFTDDDIIATVSQGHQPFKSLAETVNSVTAVFPDPAQSWQTQEIPPLIVPAYEAEEGGRRLSTTADLTAVPYKEQCQRIMQAVLDEARRARQNTVVLSQRFWPVEVGDFGEWTSSRFPYTTKLFRVDSLEDLPTGDVEVVLTEADPSDYDNWSADIDYVVIPPGSTVIQPVAAKKLVNWTVTGTAIIDGASNQRRPALELAWSDPIDDVQAVEFEIREQVTGQVFLTGSVTDVTLGFTRVIVLPNETYEARGRYVPFTSRPTDWSDWVAALSPDLKIDGGLDLKVNSLTRSLFVNGELQVALSPIDMEAVLSSDPSFQFKYSGLVEIIAVGGGGSGGAASRGTGSVSVSGGGSGALTRKFIPNADPGLFYNVAIGAGGARVGANNAAVGGLGGSQTSMTGNGLNLQAPGGAPGQATLGGTANGAAGGGIATGGDQNYPGGGSGSAFQVSGTSNNATGGGAPNLNLFDGVPTSPDMSVDATNNTGVGGYPFSPEFQSTPQAPFPLLNYNNIGYSGGIGRAVSQLADLNVYLLNDPIPPGCGGGSAGLRSNQGTTDTARSQEGGSGMVLIIYYGVKNLV